MPSSVKKEESASNSILIYVYAFSMATIGAFFGMVFLMSFPLEAYSSLEERANALEERESLKPIPGDAFYIEGPTLRTATWKDKRDQLIDGSVGKVSFTPGEINAWFGTKFRSATTAVDDEASGLTLVPDLPNLGISKEGTAYLNLPTQITGYGLDGNYVFSAQVRYASGAPARLMVDNLQIGGAAIPFPGQLGAQVVSTITKGFSSAEEYAVISEAWKRVASVEIASGELVLILNTL